MLYFQKGWKSNPITFCTELLLIADTYLKMKNGVVPLDTAGPSTTIIFQVLKHSTSNNTSSSEQLHFE